MDKHLLRTVNRAKKRIEDFQEEMPTWKVQDTQQYVERLEQTIKRMHSTSSELKIDIAGAKQEITNSNSIDDIKWNELIEEADKVLMESRDLINDLEDEVYNVRTSPKSVVKGSNALGSEIAPRLPQLSLPVFTGRAWDWPNFYASFKERVDSGPYSKLDKFEYLRQSLCGEALSTISTYIVEAGNYELALNRLKDHYGNQQLIISEMQNQLARISLRNESWHEQKQMVNTMLSLYNQLKRAGAVVDNEWVWKNIYQKFPTETTRELRKTTSIMKNTTDVEMLLTELDKLLIENITEEAIVGDGQARNRNSRFNGHGEARKSPGFSFPPRIQTEDRRDDERRRNFTSRMNGSRIGHDSPEQNLSRFGAWKPNPEATPFIVNACRLCNGAGHRAMNCTTYKSSFDRKNAARKKQLCFQCLLPGHAQPECRQKPCPKCEGNHHSSLCQAKGNETYRKSVGERSNVAHQLCVVDESKLKPADVKSYILAGTAIVSDSTGRIFEKLTVVLDSAANRTFITKKIAEKLRLPTVGSTNIATIGFGQSRTSTERCNIKEMNVTLMNSKKMTIQAVEKAEIMGDWIQRPELSEGDRNAISKLQIQLSESKKELLKKRKPDLLIGTDYFWQFCRGTPQQLPSGLFVVPTALGAMISGRQDIADPPTNVTTCLMTVADESADLTDRVNLENEQKITAEWEDDAEMAAFGGPSTEQKKKLDQQVWNHYEATVERREDGDYVRLPYKDNRHELPDNQPIAFSRLRSVERTYGADDYVMKNYQEIFQDQLEKKIIEVVDPLNPPTGEVIHYLAHQPVITPNKDTTKVRIVFDASAHFKGSVSLNDVLYQGPTILPLIVGMYLRFRTGSVVVSGDIEKAFLQVKLHEEDRDAVRFLWVKDPTLPWRGNNIIVYRYCSIPFGLNASPFLLGATIAHHFKQCRDQDFATEVIENTYVDNVILTCNSTEEGIAKYKLAKAEFAAMKMNLREFMSNDRGVLNAVELKDCSDNLSPKVLGTRWLSEEDVMEIAAVIKEAKKTTKRTVCSQVAAIYDPLGLLAPLLLQAKKFQQNLWLSYEWDDKMNLEDVDKWLAIKSSIDGFKKNIPRSIANVGTVIDLIVFSDANIDTMAACCYAVQGGRSELLISRTRLKPLKTKATIPKMEMNAYVIAIQLAADVHKELKSRISVEKVIALTDSMITLGWIQSETPPSKEGVYIERRWRNFRRIAHLLNKDNLSTYVGHVTSEENPADCATRGVCKEDFETHLWWKGPKYITKPLEEWPEKCKVAELSEEANVEHNVALVVQETPKITAIPWKATNSLQKLAGIMAWVLRFIRRKLGRLSKETREKHHQIGLLINDTEENHLSVEERDISLDLIIRIHQEEMEIEGRLRELKHLDLFKDKKGIWRCGGRLRHSELPESAIFPIFVDSKSQLAELIVRDAHVHRGTAPIHRSNRSTIATVRETYWIPSIRRIVRKVIGKCVTCQRYNNAPFPYPEMGALPKRRVVEARVFEHCGLDYLGPISFKEESAVSQRKAWVLIVTCAVSRMVHLEIVCDMSTKSFLAALSRMMSRRGVPKTITCDNATTFRMGSEILDSFLNAEAVNKELDAALATKKVKWIRITAYSPWKGGFYERLVQDVKRSFYKAAKRKLLTLEELHTVLTEIEAVLNSRPLTYLGAENSDLPILRPIDFLQRNMRLILPISEEIERDNDGTYMEPEVLAALETRKEAIEALQSSVELCNRFWKIFHREYLVSLREKHTMTLKQGRTKKMEPKVGSIVLIEDEMQPRRNWRLGRIESHTVGDDGEVREVKLAVVNQSGNVRHVSRSVNRLIPLEMEEEEVPEVIIDSDNRPIGATVDAV